MAPYVRTRCPVEQAISYFETLLANRPLPVFARDSVAVDGEEERSVRGIAEITLEDPVAEIVPQP